MKTLKHLFLGELADMYDAEKRLVKALPRLAQIATDPQLKQAFHDHLVETEGHVSKLELIFEYFEKTPKGKTCEATVGLVKEADEIASTYEGSRSINAALICAAQKVEHYEIATYGCLREWASLLECQPAVDLFDEILAEEKAANATLTTVARATSNDEACDPSEIQSAPDA